MEKIIKILLINSALMIGLILFWLGIRKLYLKEDKKYGIFIATLLITLTVIGVDISCYAAPGNDTAEKPAGEQLTFNRFKELDKIKSWQDFKTFWKKLNETAIEGKTIDSAARTLLLKNTQALVVELKKIDPQKINPLEVELLEKICQVRADYMAIDWRPRLTRMAQTSRMMVMDPQKSLLITNWHPSIISLKYQIDSLIKLKKEDKIDKENFEKAIQNIQERIKIFSILNRMAGAYSSLYRLDLIKDKNTRNDILERTITWIEKEYADYQTKKDKSEIDEKDRPYYENFDRKYNETKDILKKLKEILPSFKKLIEGLDND